MIDNFESINDHMPQKLYGQLLSVSINLYYNSIHLVRKYAHTCLWTLSVLQRSEQFAGSVVLWVLRNKTWQNLSIHVFSYQMEVIIFFTTFMVLKIVEYHIVIFPSFSWGISSPMTHLDQFLQYVSENICLIDHKKNLMLIMPWVIPDTSNIHTLPWAAWTF